MWRNSAKLYVDDPDILKELRGLRAVVKNTSFHRIIGRSSYKFLYGASIDTLRIYKFAWLVLVVKKDLLFDNQDVKWPSHATYAGKVSTYTLET